MFRCNCCGKIFYKPHMYSVEEDRGEFWGVPCTETVYYSECPECGEEDDFEKGYLYELVGTWAVCDKYEYFFWKGEFDEEIFAYDEDDAEDVLYERLQNMAYNKFRNVEGVSYTVDYIEEE